MMQHLRSVRHSWTACSSWMMWTMCTQTAKDSLSNTGCCCWWWCTLVTSVHTPWRAEVSSALLSNAEFRALVVGLHAVVLPLFKVHQMDCGVEELCV